MTVSILKMTEDKHWLKNELAAPGGKYKKRTDGFDVSALLRKMENELSVESRAASHSFFLLCL
ncbi:hypothetical protein GTB35_003955 [Salmonella enterica]|nr:hypothetical protein [Salmonella enterica subsp. enterica serovar Duisburg]EAQ4380009.1 hypothetical protein [Salmonella enterica subsp. enterica serovar Javiana]EAQ9996650.1 hypothetical protein [Salmonella enterica]EBW4555647.1 hypothetical protein [Salmonella enterica subsp. enterica serovar Anatum]ECK2417579.1 hypothetical protein [Salmonella enterica subsp. enterica serovar Oranienburg]ELE3232316.1 hypothetical protein [Salmonella enterica subsp. enterica serovar Muenchen]